MDLIGLLFTPDFFFVFALIQSVLFLLLIRFLDLYEREPLAILALMAAWGATGAVALSLIGNGIVLAALPPEVEAVFGPAIAAPLAATARLTNTAESTRFIAYVSTTGD